MGRSVEDYVKWGPHPPGPPNDESAPTMTGRRFFVMLAVSCGFWYACWTFFSR